MVSARRRCLSSGNHVGADGARCKTFKRLAARRRTYIEREQHPPLLLQQSPRSRTRLSHACFAGRVMSGLRRALRPETAHCRSLISHSHPAVSLSCASGLGGLCSWSKKYTPLTFATSGEVASHTRVSAPFSGLRDTGLSIVIPKSISRSLLRLNPVATSPGWKQFAVTPVPSSRRASSVVNRMLASLVSQ